MLFIVCQPHQQGSSLRAGAPSAQLPTVPPASHRAWQAHALSTCERNRRGAPGRPSPLLSPPHLTSPLGLCCGCSSPWRWDLGPAASERGTQDDGWGWGAGRAWPRLSRGPCLGSEAGGRAPIQPCGGPPHGPAHSAHSFQTCVPGIGWICSLCCQECGSK